MHAAIMHAALHGKCTATNSTSVHSELVLRCRRCTGQTASFWRASPPQVRRGGEHARIGTRLGHHGRLPAHASACMRSELPKTHMRQAASPQGRLHLLPALRCTALRCAVLPTHPTIPAHNPPSPPPLRRSIPVLSLLGSHHPVNGGGQLSAGQHARDHQASHGAAPHAVANRSRQRDFGGVEGVQRCSCPTTGLQLLPPTATHSSGAMRS